MKLVKIMAHSITYHIPSQLQLSSSLIWDHDMRYMIPPPLNKHPTKADSVLDPFGSIHRPPHIEEIRGGFRIAGYRSTTYHQGDIRDIGSITPGIDTPPCWQSPPCFCPGKAIPGFKAADGTRRSTRPSAPWQLENHRTESAMFHSTRLKYLRVED